MTPVPVQPAGMLFYRAKNFYRRNVWTIIFSWGGKVLNLIKIIVFVKNFTITIIMIIVVNQ